MLSLDDLEQLYDRHVDKRLTKDDQPNFCDIALKSYVLD